MTFFILFYSISLRSCWYSSGWHQSFFQHFHCLDGANTYQRYVYYKHRFMHISSYEKCIFLYSLKAYLMGCAFDMYSQSWNGLSYSMMLFVYCFIMPICVIFFSYIGIIYHTRTSRKGLFGDNESPKKPEIGKVFDRRLRRRQSSHTNQRVSSSIKRTIRGAIFV